MQSCPTTAQCLTPPPFPTMPPRENPTRRPARKPKKPRRLVVPVSASLYASYQPPSGADPLEPSENLVRQITACLADSMAALDCLKRALGLLSEVERSQSMRSTAMVERFKEGAAEVRKAVATAPALEEKEVLVELFNRPRVLATNMAAKEAGEVVKDAQRWLRAMIKSIGRDLVEARSAQEGEDLF